MPIIVTPFNTNRRKYFSGTYNYLTYRMEQECTYLSTGHSPYLSNLKDLDLDIFHYLDRYLPKPLRVQIAL